MAAGGHSRSERLARFRRVVLPRRADHFTGNAGDDRCLSRRPSRLPQGVKLGAEGRRDRGSASLGGLSARPEPSGDCGLCSPGSAGALDRAKKRGTDNALPPSVRMTILSASLVAKALDSFYRVCLLTATSPKPRKSCRGAHFLLGLQRSGIAFTAAAPVPT
jgi:hypothetical protein